MSNEHNGQHRELLSHEQILELKRWNTPTIYNGWEQITHQDSGKDGFNLEPVVDFMPQMGPMVGYAVTVICQPGKAEHQKNNPNAASECYRYIASVPGPKIVVVQDLDKPATYGSYWGEVNSNRHRALGCVGTITDGAVRDVDEMTNAGFKALARRMCVGHAYSTPIRWGCEVEVFGRKVQPGQLIHGDKHGFLAIPFGEEKDLLEASRFMDSNECKSLILTARNTAGKTMEEILEGFDRAGKLFARNAKEKFGKKN
jgi:4-hydroxy-4-methyl-2-oxoglutarate aldolase